MRYFEVYATIKVRKTIYAIDEEDAQDRFYANEYDLSDFDDVDYIVENVEEA